jgi:hypothetical protein
MAQANSASYPTVAPTGCLDNLECRKDAFGAYEGSKRNHVIASEAIHFSAHGTMDCFRLRSPSFGGLPAAVRSLRSKRRRVVAVAPRNDMTKYAFYSHSEDA